MFKRFYNEKGRRRYPIFILPAKYNKYKDCECHDSLDLLKQQVQESIH